MKPLCILKISAPFRSFIMFLAFPSTMLAGDAKSTVVVSNSGNWEFSLSVGAAYRQAGTLEFSGGSRAPGLSIPSLVGSDSLTVPVIGDEGKFGDRTYNDGFVRRDFGTANDGLTTNWGYQNSGQAAGDEIAFHATGYQNILSGTQSFGPALSNKEDERGLAPVLGFNAKSKESLGGFRPGFSATLSWMPIRMNLNRSDTLQSQTRDDFRLDYTDHYNLGGVGAFLPAAPYAGSATAPGFVLENLPDSRDIVSVPIRSESATISNNITTRFRANHTTFSFGPTVERELSKEWTLQAGAGLSLHWLHWSASQNEIVTSHGNSGATRLAEWHDSTSGDHMLSGVYMQIGSEWHPAGHTWSVTSFLRGDLGNSATLNVGPSVYTYDVDGYTAAVMFHFPL